MIDPCFYVRIDTLPLAQLLSECGLPAVKLAAGDITGVAAPEHAAPGELIFIESAKYLDAARASRASFILCKPELALELPSEKAIPSPTPQLHFITAIHQLYPAARQPTLEDAKPISPSAKIAKTARIGHGAIIGAGAEIGANSIIGPNTVIAPGVIIGTENDIGANVTISHTITAERVRVLAGARIGQDGFGFVTHNGQHIRIPQLGRVTIGANTEIGANATIDRGTLVDTVIGKNVIVDNLVQIGHNVVIGDGAILVSQTGISGSSRIGRYAVLAGQVGVADHLEIGDFAQIGAQSGIMRDVEPKARMMGSPALPLREYLRQFSALAKSGRPAKSKP
jgi:UDP-3-O-[3-hydroxymyristoyl] glucosamine N-acyltransferase